MYFVAVLYAIFSTIFSTALSPRSIDLMSFCDYFQEKVENPRSKSTGRFRQEYTGTWKQYSGRKISGFFLVHSDHFPVLSARNWSEIIGKNPEIFRLEYCFHVPVTSGVFLQDPAFFLSLSCRFLRVLVTGIFDLG